MVAEWLGGDPRRCAWTPDRDRQRPLAWDELLDELAAAAPAHAVVKLQVTGPATLACALERRGGGPPSCRSAAALAHELAVWLAANAGEWVAALARRGLSALLVVDKKGLHVFGTRGLEEIWDPLRAIAAAWGLHLCCAVPWELVCAVAPDVLSFDLACEPVDRRAREPRSPSRSPTPRGRCAERSRRIPSEARHRPPPAPLSPGAWTQPRSV